MSVWEEIVDYTVPSNTTSVVLNNFGTITKDDFIKVVMTHANPIGSASFIGVFPNSNTTTTNYHSQYLEGIATSVVASRLNENKFNVTVSNKTATHHAYIKISENNKYNSFSNSNVQIGSNPHILFYYVTQSGGTNTTSITSLTFQSSVTNGIGSGSRIQIYRLTAEKVADITVASNTTQVDITGLDIQKGSEYLLVSDIFRGDNGSNLHLYVNNNTTSSDYYTQRVRGSGSSPSAVRQNDPTFIQTTANNSCYVHIKLSNIGAFTAQSYTINNTGTSNVDLINWFLSSTSENITSINQFNLKSTISNSIGSGTRFQLYKLY